MRSSTARSLVRLGTSATPPAAAPSNVDKGKARQLPPPGERLSQPALRGRRRLMFHTIPAKVKMTGESCSSSSSSVSRRPQGSSLLIACSRTDPLSLGTLLGRALHTGAPTLDASASKRSSSAASSTSPPLPPPLPTPFAGLGTTQLSPDILLRCTIFDSTGSATSTSGVFKKSLLCSQHGLEPRDLRKIDSRVPNLVPTILARRGGILVNILHIRAMIKADKVLLFDSYGSTDSQLHSAFVYNLQHNLRQGGGVYEFRALESILVSVLDALRIELGVVRGWTRAVLEGLDDDVDREKLRELLQVSRKLNGFLSRAKAVKGAVTEVLENEEDMMLMYLSTSPPSAVAAGASAAGAGTTGGGAAASAGADPTSTEATPGMDELELLLESFDKQTEEVVAETTQLHSDITNTQEVVELILDNNRNKLLALDLKTSIATMGISAGTLWAGLFGMNLKSHMEELDWAFTVVSGTAFGAVLVTAGVGLRRLERLRRVGLGMQPKKARAGWLERWRRKEVAAAAAAGGGGWREQPAVVGGGGVYGYNPTASVAGEGVALDQRAEQGAGWWSHPPPSPTSPPHPPFHDYARPTPHHPAATPISPGADPASPAPAAERGALGMGLGSKWDSTLSAKAGKKKLRKPT